MNLDLPFNVHERDIDLLLLEQLHLSTEFVSWFTGRVGVSEAAFVHAKHSVMGHNGETDLLLFVQSPSGRVAIMIEDKIGAAMQPRQCERYHERGKALCDGGQVQSYKTVLCAPEMYLTTNSKMDNWQSRISFEDIAKWFSLNPSPLHDWRASVLKSASSKIARARRADDMSNRSVDADLSLLKSAYRAFINEHHPELIASEQTGRDREYYLRATGLPKGIRFKHSFFGGSVSLVLERNWADAGKKWVASNLPEGCTMVQHDGELHVLKPTDVLDPALALTQQYETVRMALEAIGELVLFANCIITALK